MTAAPAILRPPGLVLPDTRRLLMPLHPIADGFRAGLQQIAHGFTRQFKPAGGGGPFGGHASLASGLLAYWDLDEASGDRADKTGSYDLTDVNTVGSAGGVLGGAADFERDNGEYLSSGTNITSVIGSGAFSVSAWINPETLGNSGDGTGIVANLSASTLGPGDFYVALRNNGGIRFSVGGDLSYYATPGMVTGSWYHVVASWDGDSVAKVWTNGVEGVGSSGALSGGFSAIGLVIGMNYPSSVWYFDGLIDEVGIWTRALTSGEVADLYNSGAGLAYD